MWCSVFSWIYRAVFLAIWFNFVLSLEWFSECTLILEQYLYRRGTRGDCWNSQGDRIDIIYCILIYIYNQSGTRTQIYKHFKEVLYQRAIECIYMHYMHALQPFPPISSKYLMQESQMFQPAEALALASRKPAVREEARNGQKWPEYRWKHIYHMKKYWMLWQNVTNI